MRPPPGFDRADDYARLRDVLAACNYTEAGARDAIGVPPHENPRLTDRPRLLRRLDGGSPLHVLCRLFLVGAPVPEADARRAFEPMDLECLLEAGLVARGEGGICRTVRLVPHRDLVLISDIVEDFRPMAADSVMGIGGSTISLANAMIRRPARKALDLGTGSGVLALLAAGHAEQVWATDCNPRATEFAAFNARLNGLERVTCLTGHLLEPVREHAFDYIICSPPYVISPVSRLTYRDNELGGDEFCRRVLVEAAAHLEEGGFAQVLLNWPHYAGQDWRDGFAELLADSGCDFWLLTSEEKALEDYAAMWLEETEYSSLDDYTAAFDQWMRYYDEQGIKRIGFGLCTLRRRSTGANWIRFDKAPDKMLGPVGDDIALGFELHEFVLTADDEQILDTPFQLAAGVRMHQEFHPQDGTWRADAVQLGQGRGLKWTANVDLYVAGLTARCDGQHPLRELIGHFAEATEQPVDAVTAPVLQVVRTLVDHGCLLPARLG